MHEMNPSEARALLERMFRAAIEAAQPVHCVRPFLPEAPKGRLVVIGAGKASAAMAQAVEQAWPGPLHGVVVTRYGYAVPCQRIEVLESAHPVPDQAGLDAAQRILQTVQGLSADDTVLCLISGGGSALMPLPLAGLSLADKQHIHRELLRCGASIREMNCVRRHLSAIKGGRLAAACYPARLVNLLISDVPGDDPCDIASGPTVADPSTCDDALAILRRYGLQLPAHVQEVLESGQGESVKPGDPRLSRMETHLIATPHKALQAAADVARTAGLSTHLLSDCMEGEARDVGKTLAAMAMQVARTGQPFAPPCVLLSGGETTVTLPAPTALGAGASVGSSAGASAGSSAGSSAGAEAGRELGAGAGAPDGPMRPGVGGRNVEFLLALGLALRGQRGIYALAGDTDGVDGQAEIAGAFWAPDSLERAWALGLRPQDRLDSHDGHGFFSRLGDSVITGPTLTNVNDFRAILVLA